MSEKRFKLLSGGFDEEGNPLYRIDTTDMLGNYEICKKVIEQQAIISALKEKNIELKKLKKYCAEWMGVKEENLSLRCGEMSDERFAIKPQDDYWAVIDNHNDDKVCIINGIHTEIEAMWLCDFMNEQQATINKLQEELKLEQDFASRWQKESEMLAKENEMLKKWLLLYDEDEVDKYLRTHPMPTTTITNKRKVIPLNMRHKW